MPGAPGEKGRGAGLPHASPGFGGPGRAGRCRECDHEDGPGGAVRAAVASGEVAPERLASDHKLVGEAQVVVMKTEVRLRAEEGREAKAHKAAKDDDKRTERG